MVFTIANLKSRIVQYIKNNFLQLITGSLLQGILIDIVDSFSALLSTATNIISNHISLTESESHDIAIDFSDYTLTWSAYDSEGAIVGCKIIFTSTGFTVTADATCTFHYQYIKL
jgi:hypothetical protein